MWSMSEAAGVVKSAVEVAVNRQTLFLTALVCFFMLVFK